MRFWLTAHRHDGKPYLRLALNQAHLTVDAATRLAFALLEGVDAAKGLRGKNEKDLSEICEFICPCIKRS